MYYHASGGWKVVAEVFAPHFLDASITHETVRSHPLDSVHHVVHRVPCGIQHLSDIAVYLIRLGCHIKPAYVLVCGVVHRRLTRYVKEATFLDSCHVSQSAVATFPLCDANLLSAPSLYCYGLYFYVPIGAKQAVGDDTRSRRILISVELTPHGVSIAVLKDSLRGNLVQAIHYVTRLSIACLQHFSYRLVGEGGLLGSILRIDTLAVDLFAANNPR